MAFQQQRKRTSKRTNQHQLLSSSSSTSVEQWLPTQRDIEVAVSLLKSTLPQTQAVAHKRPDLKDFYAALALSGTLFFCLSVLPPEVAAIAREHYQAIQDAYSLPESEG